MELEDFTLASCQFSFKVVLKMNPTTWPIQSTTEFNKFLNFWVFFSFFFHFKLLPLPPSPLPAALLCICLYSSPLFFMERVGFPLNTGLQRAAVYCVRHCVSVNVWYILGRRMESSDRTQIHTNKEVTKIIKKWYAFTYKMARVRIRNVEICAV